MRIFASHLPATMPSSKCHHGVWKFWCKPCGGGGYCQHDKNRYTCQECKDAGGTTSLCDHGKRRHSCEQCGTTKCQHGNSRRQCHQCGQRCPHGKRKARCHQCGGASLCIHGTRKDKKTDRGQPACRQCRDALIANPSDPSESERIAETQHIS